MSRVTSKLQVTIPKALARQYGIQPGDDIEFRPAGSEIRVLPPRVVEKHISAAERLRLFRDARARQRQRERSMPRVEYQSGDRGWTRDDLYRRGDSAESDLPDGGSGKDR